MNGRCFRRMLTAFCLSALGLLLLAGLPRLIAGTDEAPPAFAARPDCALLAAPGQTEEARCAARETSPARRGEAQAAAPRAEAPAPANVWRDANGNVLGAASYLKAVYRAFSLGDGFV